MKSLVRKKMQRFFFYLIWKLLPTCKEYVPILSESLDRELSLYKKVIVKLHLTACPPCVRYLKQIKFVSEASHKCDEKLLKSEPNIKLSDESRERIKNLLKHSAITLGIFTGF